MAYLGAGPIEKGTGLFSQDTFTGDGSTVAFDMTNAAPDGGGNEIQVFVDNVRQQEGGSNAYTLGFDGSGNLKRITFTAAPAAAASIYVLNPGTTNVQQISTVSDNTVTTAKVQNNAVTVAKLASTLDLSSNTVTLPNLSVATAKIAADAIDATKLADDAISEEHLDVTAITGNPELSATASGDDVLLVFDTSSGTIKKIQASNINSAPTITSISPTNALSGDGTGNFTFVITGTNFNASATAFFVNNSGTEVLFDTVTRDSITQITGVIAKSSLLTTGEPFDIVVENPNGQSAKKRNQVNVDATPAYVTAAGTLGTVTGGSAISTIDIVAADPDSAGAISFELQSGSVSAGLSTATVTENGVSKFRITGTPTNPDSNTTSNFVLRAVDAASNTSSRAFSITVNRAYTSQSFTSSGTFAVPSGTTTTDVLVVAAGGGGGPGGPTGAGCGAGGGGGGAGGLIFMPAYPLTPGGTITVTVGSGGSSNSNGQDSVFGAPGDPGKHASGDVLTAKGGGAGGTTPLDAGSPGGSGGGGGAGNGSRSAGGSAVQPTQPGDGGAYGFGNTGGTSSGTDYQSGGGGGGGAGAVGGGQSGFAGAPGGIGKAYTIGDGTTSVYYAGGGGGGGGHIPGGGQVAAPGGQGGAGQGGAAPNGSGQAGQANKGGGAGGGSQPSAPAGTGGKGIVIVRY
jgi:mucin-19